MQKHYSNSQWQIIIPINSVELHFFLTDVDKIKVKGEYSEFTKGSFVDRLVSFD